MNKIFSLALAFRLRNKIKARIVELTKLLGTAEEKKKRQRAAVYSAPSPKPKAVKKLYPQNNEYWMPNYDGMEFHEVVSRVEALMTTLRDLNAAIDKANAMNREKVNDLDTIIAKLSFYKSLHEQCNSIEPFTYEHDADGHAHLIKQEPLINPAELAETIKGLKRQKEEIEEYLIISNSQTPVDFDREAAENIL